MFYPKPLLYSLQALQPYIDEQTMDEHYNVHYKKYTANLNEALVNEPQLNLDYLEKIQRILKNYKDYPKTVRDNGGGYYNHLLYFENISPYHKVYDEFASPELKEILESRYKSYEHFKEMFTRAGEKVFGSGWVWLILKGNELVLVTTNNQDNPIMELDCKILLCMDVWEHAYYLKHKADRKAYIDDFFNVIDWKVVSERLI